MQSIIIIPYHYVIHIILYVKTHARHTYTYKLASPSFPPSCTPLSAQQWVNSYHRGVLENFPCRNRQPQDAHISMALILESWKEIRKIRQNMYNSTYLYACHTSPVLSLHTVFLPITLLLKKNSYVSLPPFMSQLYICI